MTDFIVTITDPDQLAGITWARDEHNAALLPLPGEEEPPPDGYCATDADYVQWVMEEAASSYARQQNAAAWNAAQTRAQERNQAAPGA